MKYFNEFKKFISRGNVVEMAVGLILATYFGAIVKSFVNDVIMPPIGMLLGGIDFAEMKYVIKEGTPETAAGAGDAIAEVAISYGLFINTIITFLIVALVIFWVARSYNNMIDRMRKKEDTVPPAAPVPSKEEELLSEIRDILRNK